MKVVTIRQKKYELLEQISLNDWRTNYILKSIDTNEKHLLKIEDYREAEFVINGKINSVMHKIGDQHLITVLRPENIEFKEENKKREFKIFNFLSPKNNSIERKRHLAKTITWRIIGSVDTIVLSYFITGSFKIGISIGFMEFFSKMILYYLHERTWYKYIKLGINKNDKYGNK